MTAPCDHTRLRRASQWHTLPLLGVQQVPAGADGPAYKLELRNCPACHSTLAVEVRL